MRLEDLFDTWMARANDDSEISPIESLSFDAEGILVPFHAQLLHLIFNKLSMLQIIIPKTQPILAQMKVCMTMAEKLMSFEVQSQSFFHTLFSIDTAGKSLYQKMQDLKLKRIKGIYQLEPPRSSKATQKNTANNFSNLVETEEWIPSFYSYSNSYSYSYSYSSENSPYKKTTNSLFMQDDQSLTMKGFCAHNFITDLNIAITSGATFFRRFQYGMSPITYYQNLVSNTNNVKDVLPDEIPVSLLQHTYNPSLLITRTIADKYRKEGVTETPPQVSDVLDTLVDKNKFNTSPLSKHSNPVLRLFNYHGDTHTVVTVYQEAKKDLIRQALNHPHDRDGLNKIGTALRALLAPDSTARKIIRRPLDKRGYSNWLYDEADTASYTLITAAIDVLYIFKGRPNDCVALNTIEPLLSKTQREALNALASYTGNNKQPFNAEIIFNNLTT